MSIISSVIHRSQLTISSVSWPVTTGHFGHPVFCGHKTFLLYCLRQTISRMVYKGLNTPLLNRILNLENLLTMIQGWYTTASKMDNQ